MNLQKLLGASYATSLAGIGMLAGAALMIYAMFTNHIPMNEANIGITIGLLAGGKLGLDAKSKTVTGIETGSPVTTTATTDPALDGTKLPPSKQ